MQLDKRFVCTLFLSVVLLYALYSKGDVRAALKIFGAELSLDVKEKTPAPKPLPLK